MTIANASPQRTAALSFILTSAGFLLGLASALDFFTLVFPDSTPSSVDWRLQTLTQLVDRGVIPLLGFALILLGSWLRLTLELGRKRSLGVLNIIVFVASGLLGLMYLGVAPLHFRDSGIASTNAITQLNDQVKQAEQQLDSRINQEINRISGIIGDENQIKQLQNLPKNLTPDQQKQATDLLNQIREFKSDPNALQDRAQKSRDQFLSQIRLQQKNLESQIQQNYWKSTIRVPLESLLLAIGYLFIAINGLQILTR